MNVHSSAKLIVGTITTLLMGAVMSNAAAAQGAYERPTTVIVPVSLPSLVATALREICQDNCAGTRWADRTFAEGISVAVEGDTALMSAGNASELLERLHRAGIPRQYLLKQFQADGDFDWKLTGLQARSAYAQTVAEARVRVNEMSGAAVEDFRTIPGSYIVAVHAPNIERKSGKDLLGNATIEMSTTLHASVFKIGYKTQSDIPAALSEYFCSSCSDKEQRRAKFSQYTVPFDHVSSFTVNASASVPERDGDAKAVAALGESALDELMAEMAAEISEFSVQEKVIAVNPVAVRIGKKEGLRKGARFFHYTLEEDANGSQVQKRRAVLVAKSIADNRVNAMDRSAAVGVTVAAVDSSTFRQVYPGKVGRGDVVKETPSAISFHAGGGAFNGEPMLYGEVRSEELAGQIGLPPSIRFLLSAKLFRYGAPSEYANLIGDLRYTFIGIGAGYELHPLNGRIRLMPVVVYNALNNIAPLASTNSDESFEADPSIEFGVDFGIRLHPTVELTGTLRQAGYNDYFSTDLVSTATMFGIGLRLQRGRWGF